MINNNKKKIVVLIATLFLGVGSAFAAGNASEEYGLGASAPGTNSSAFGNAVRCGTSNDRQASCFGQDITAGGQSVSVGNQLSTGGGSINQGVQSSTQSFAINTGNGSTIGNSSVSTGNNANVDEGGINYGSNSTVGIEGSSFGKNNNVGMLGQNVGNGNTVKGGKNFGNNNTVTSSNVVLGGNFVNTTGVYDTVILGDTNGNALRSTEVQVGDRTIGGVANATFADQAVNFQQMQNADTAVLNSANTYTDSKLGTMGSDISSLQNDVSGVQSDVSSLKNQVGKLSDRIDSSNAMSSAQSNIIFNPYGSQYQIGVGAGYSGSSSALSMKVMGASKDKRYIFSVGASVASSGSPSVGAGMTFNIR